MASDEIEVCEVEGCANWLGGPRDGVTKCEVCLAQIEEQDREHAMEDCQ